MRAPGRRTTFAVDVALVVTWSSGFVGAELAARAHGAPVSVLAARFVVLTLLLAPTWLVVARVRGHRLPGRAAWGRQVLIGSLSQPVYLLLVFEGVRHGVPGGTAALIAALQPLLVATVAGRLLDEPSTARTWLGLLLGLVGVALVVSGDLGLSGAPAWAYALPFIAMLSLTAGTVISRRLRPPESLFDTITMQSVVSVVALGAVALATGQADVPMTWPFWRAVLWLVALPSLGGYVCYVYVTATQGATLVSTLLYLTPPTTMLWVFLMFGTPVPWLGVLGLVVCAVGVALVIASRTRRARERGRALSSSAPARA